MKTNLGRPQKKGKGKRGAKKMLEPAKARKKGTLLGLTN